MNTAVHLPPMFSPEYPETLAKLGFKFTKGGTHGARTMMLAELERIMVAAGDQGNKKQYRREVIDENVLNKPTVRSRNLTHQHLRALYVLDPTICLFRVFRTFWFQDADAHPVLALQLTMARDALLRLSAPLVLKTPAGEVFTRERIEALLGHAGDSRFSTASTRSFARNINSTWTQAGYLRGRVRKVRTYPVITPTNVAFALFLAYLEGARAQRLFYSAWVQLMACTKDQLQELTAAASNRGLLVMLSAGGVVELRFPNYLTAQEKKLLHE